MKSLSFQWFYIEQEIDRARHDPDSVWNYLLQLHEDKQSVQVPAISPESEYDQIKQSVKQIVMDKVGDVALDTTPGLLGNVLSYVFSKGGAFLRRLFIRRPPKPTADASPAQLKDYELATRRRDEKGERFGVATKFLGGVAVAALYYALMIGMPYMKGRESREGEVQQLQQQVQQLRQQVAALPPDQKQAGMQIAQELQGGPEKGQQGKALDRDNRQFMLLMANKTYETYRKQYAGSPVTMKDVYRELEFVYGRARAGDQAARFWYDTDPDRLAELLAQRVFQRNRRGG